MELAGLEPATSWVRLRPIPVRPLEIGVVEPVA
jgi:hypothetical protein